MIGLSFIALCAKYSTLWIFWGFTRWKLCLRPLSFFTSNSKPHDTTSLHACPEVYGTWQSQAVTHPIMNRARRCLTSVIEPTPMSQRRTYSVQVRIKWCQTCQMVKLGVKRCGPYIEGWGEGLKCIFKLKGTWRRRHKSHVQAGRVEEGVVGYSTGEIWIVKI